MARGYGASVSNNANTLACTDAHSVPRAGDEAQLHAGGWIVGSEELLVAVAVDGDIGEQRCAGLAEARPGVAGVEHLDRDVLHARPACGQVAGHGR